MKFIKPVFYALIALVCIYLIYAIYISSTQGNNGVGFGVTVIFALSFISIGAAVIFPLIYMINHPKSAVRALIGIGLVLALFGLGYALSGNEILLAYEDVDFTSPAASKLVGGSLIMMYMMIAAVLVVTVYSEVRKMFK